MSNQPSPSLTPIQKSPLEDLLLPANPSSPKVGEGAFEQGGTNQKRNTRDLDKKNQAKQKQKKSPEKSGGSEQTKQNGIEDVGAVGSATTNPALPPAPYVAEEFKGKQGEFEKALNDFGGKYPNLTVTRDGRVNIDTRGLRQLDGTPLGVLTFPAIVDAQDVKRAVLKSGGEVIGYAIEVKINPEADEKNPQYGMLVYSKDSTGKVCLTFHRTNFEDLQRVYPFTKDHGVENFKYNPKFLQNPETKECKIFKQTKSSTPPGTFQEINTNELVHYRSLNSTDVLGERKQLYGLAPFLEMAQGKNAPVVKLPDNPTATEIKYVLPVSSSPSGPIDGYLFFTESAAGAPVVAGLLNTAEAMVVLRDIGTTLKEKRASTAEARDKGTVLQGQELERVKATLRPHFPEISAQSGDKYVTVDFNKDDFSGSEERPTKATIDKTPGVTPTITTEIRQFGNDAGQTVRYEVAITVTDPQSKQQSRVVGDYSAAGEFLSFRNERVKDDEGPATP